MKQKEKQSSNCIEKRKTGALLAAVLIAALLLTCFVRDLACTGKTNDMVDVVLLGDSVMGKERVVYAIHDQLEEKTGLRVYNGAFGGTCASICDKEYRYSYHEDSLNLVQLTDAICNRDFGVQLADLPNNQFKMDYFKEVVNGLSKIDFSKVDMVLIEHGMNDYNGFRVVDDLENPYNIRTYGGALRYSVEKLQAAYPNLRIVMVTSNYCWISGLKVCSEQDFGQGTMDDYVDKQLEIADQYGLDVIDVYHNAGFNKDNIVSLTEDGAHLNEEGRLMYGQFLADEIMKLRQ